MVKIRNKPAIKRDGSISLEEWLAHIHCDTPLIRSANLLARIAGEDHTNPYNQNCFLQGLEIAEEIVHLNLGEEVIAAALIFPAVEYANLSLDDIEEQLGTKVAQLIKNTQSLHVIGSLDAQSHKQIDAIRKMLLSMIKDVRVVMLKLAERVSVMRACHHLADKKRLRLAKETMAVYAPLASRLGAHLMKWQLEDISFAILEPESYKAIAKMLKERRIDREARVHTLTSQLNQFLRDTNIAGEVQGRAKHIYSIHRKMQRKKVDISEIYDAIALRILVPEVKDCYTLLSYVHDTWHPIKEEFDDYVANPKPNGYRSIHTAAHDEQGKTFEVQIRTFQMHEESEMGVAAHWAYKEGTQTSGYEEKIKWLRQLLEWQKEMSADEELPAELEKNVFEDRIYVFTPGGDVIDLPNGATPLDFAYHIHTDLGHRCRGAKVKNKLVPLTSQLQLGDVVEILTSKNAQPSRDWLIPQRGYLKSARARAKVLNWFKKQDFTHHIDDGRNILEREIKRLSLDPPNMDKLASELGYKQSDLMFAALGHGDLRLTQVINKLQNKLDINPIPTQEFYAIENKKFGKKYQGDIAIYGVGDLLTQIANCCKPVPGDPIIGYITQGHGVSIHHRDCKNITNLSDEYANRLIEVDWITETRSAYPVDIEVHAYDRPGLVSDVAQILANDKISIVRLITNINRKQHMATITVTIEICDLNDLGRIIDRFNQIPNVKSVKRKRANEEK